MKLSIRVRLKKRKVKKDTVGEVVREAVVGVDPRRKCHSEARTAAEGDLDPLSTKENAGPGDRTD